MAYEVTATRKRPHKFEDLTGQEFVVSTLSNSIANQRIAHAYLFSGPRGVGKTSAARILARSLNCEQGPTVNPCGTCTSCQEISKGSSMDVIEIDGASNTGVNDIREIKDEVLFAPNSSRYKVYIIDEVHMLSNSAFNALLKTIEEPPPYIIFIFATTEIHKVPATIRSRCQQFNFRLIGLEQVKNLLAGICQETSTQYEDDALLWIAKEGTGSLRDSYTLFDQVASFSEGNITLDKIREKLGLVGMEQINALVKVMLNEDSSQVMELCEQILTSGVSVDQFLVELAEFFRSILLLKSGITRQSIIGYEKDKFDQTILDAYTEEQILHGQELIFKLYREIRYSLNERFELELLLNRLIHLKEYLSSRQILGRVERLKQDLKIAHIQDESHEALVAGVEDDKKKSPEPPAVSHDEAAEAFFRKFEKSAAGQIREEGEPQADNEPSGEALSTPPEDSVQGADLSPTEERQAAPGDPPVGTEAVAESAHAAPIPQNTTLSDDVSADVVPAPPQGEGEDPMDQPGSWAALSGQILWEQMLKRLRKDQDMHLYSLLDRSEESRMDDKTIHLTLAQAYDAHSVEEEEKKIVSLLRTMTGRNYRLSVEVVQSAIQEEAPRLNNQVEQIRRIFQGQIVHQGAAK